MSANIYALSHEIREINLEHGFDSKVPGDNPAAFGEKMALIHSEISEALEEFRNGRALAEVYDSDEDSRKPEGVPIELADAVIRILDFCAANDIDLAHAIELKLAYNRIRPFRHGGKKA
jgi:hypothetical protein